jgi:hypothetical protein
MQKRRIHHTAITMSTVLMIVLGVAVASMWPLLGMHFT